MVVPKHELEAALHEENKAIRAGKLKEDNPLDFSEDFRLLCDACRRGDLKLCQEQLSKGVNINARDQFDYTPLILVCTLRAPHQNHFALHSPLSWNYPLNNCLIAPRLVCVDTMKLCSIYSSPELFVSAILSRANAACTML